MMTTPRAFLILSAVFAVGCASHGGSGAERQPTPAITAPNSGLVGTWRLVEFWDRDSTAGRLTYPYGERPTGYFVYDASGHVFIQIAKGPAGFRVDQARGESWFVNAPSDELERAVSDFRAYYGTYAVDAIRGIVVHQVEGDSRGLYTGTPQIRLYRLAGDSLILGNDTTGRRALIRVR